jgi:hypothetical protein
VGFLAFPLPHVSNAVLLVSPHLGRAGNSHLILTAGAFIIGRAGLSSRHPRLVPRRSVSCVLDSRS